MIDVEPHLGLAYMEARRAARYCPQIEEADHLGAAFVGLVSAGARFDPACGHAFSSYACPRIRGQIQDQRRRLSRGSRQGRALRWAHLPAWERSQPRAPERLSPDERGQLARIWMNVRRLDYQERQVMELVYHEGLLLRDAGERMGISESRVCQVRNRALRRLRAWMGAN